MTTLVARLPVVRPVEEVKPRRWSSFIARLNYLRHTSAAPYVAVVVIGAVTITAIHNVETEGAIWASFFIGGVGMVLSQLIDIDLVPP